MTILEQLNQEIIDKFTNEYDNFKLCNIVKKNDYDRLYNFIEISNRTLFDKINQEWVKCLPKEKIREIDKFADKKIGKDYQNYRKGFNDCLNQLTQSAIKAGLMKGK